LAGAPLKVTEAPDGTFEQGRFNRHGLKTLHAAAADPELQWVCDLTSYTCGLIAVANIEEWQSECCAGRQSKRETDG
jgi:hypothetical protein